MDQNQHTMLLRHRDESRQQENNHSDTTSTVSEVTSPTTQPATSTPNPPQANPGSLIWKMLSNHLYRQPLIRWRDQHQLLISVGQDYLNATNTLAKSFTN